MQGEDNAMWARLVRYFAEECSPEEQCQLETWIQANFERQELVDELRYLWKVSGKVPSGEGAPAGELDVEADWEELMQKIRAEERKASVSGQHSSSQPARQRSARSFERSSLSLRQFVGVAVIVILLISVGTLSLRLIGNYSPNESSVRELVTHRGERATLRLADDTEVKLNVDSQLRLSKTFGRDSIRAVYLQGEGYFNVASNDERPFIVHAGQTAVRVEGTEFNVEAYPDAEQVEVAVADGVVMFASEEEERSALGVQLKRGQLGRFSTGSMHIAKEQVDVDAHLSWLDGRLVFNDTPLTDVITKLERWYDVDFEVHDGVTQSLHLTASFNSRSIQDIMDVIAPSLELQYRIEGNTVFLMQKE